MPTASNRTAATETPAMAAVPNELPDEAAPEPILPEVTGTPDAFELAGLVLDGGVMAWLSTLTFWNSVADVAESVSATSAIVGVVHVPREV